jgi:multidrug efflux system outer membrane protein
LISRRRFCGVATAEDRRTVQISLIAQVAADDLQLAADLQLQDLARDTLRARCDSLRIIRLRAEHGAASGIDLARAQGLEQQARRDLAAADARVEQDRNALRLVVGAEVPKSLEPGPGVGVIRMLQTVPVGLPSTVLTRRPDVLSAEHLLKAQNADIGAARAAFLPQITLTGSAGQQSAALGELFDGASRALSFSPKITLPVFDGGAHLAALDIAKAGRRIAVAQ